MVRGGRVPEYQVALSYLRGKKDLTTMRFMIENNEEVNLQQKKKIKKQRKHGLQIKN